MSAEANLNAADRIFQGKQKLVSFNNNGTEVDTMWN